MGTNRLRARRLRLGPEFALRINSRTLQIRGARIHHDTGILVSAASRGQWNARLRPRRRPVRLYLGPGLATRFVCSM